ncbi:amidase family protein [Pontivivens ytuae]|uniref:Indole acetimide hydrolase n=1 Tax=Pontivivens ytuae TaxID=2789856 RepID=A0A7S9LQY9_9RHOB|nr:amidase family protein [Pontivivens ytuae]QPH53686.1 indole acetimide hydrolase [Pontivivens ytuae]
MTALIREVRVSGADSGPLAGETLVVKANIAVAGQPWDGASPALASVMAESNAPAVDRALAAGASIVGQANMHELAFGITSDNAAFGAVESPHGGMAGGSSGGTAAAIAGGLATMGLGTDTGGSGRIPAAFCGVVGFRPTTGRYPAGGVLTLSSSLDTISAMAADVAGLTRLDAALAGGGEEAMPADLSGIRLGRIRDPFWMDLDGRVERRVEEALDLLRTAGATVEERDIGGITDAIEATALPLVVAEARRWWAPFLREKLQIALEDFPPRIASADVAEVFRAIASDTTDDATLEKLRRDGISRIRGLLEQALDGLDALVYPAVPIAAPPVGTTEVELNGTTHALFPLLTNRALAASLSGAPAISLPIRGFDARPLGLELMGRPQGDRALIGIALAAERVIR